MESYETIRANEARIFDKIVSAYSADPEKIVAALMPVEEGEGSAKWDAATEHAVRTACGDLAAIRAKAEAQGSIPQVVYLKHMRWLRKQWLAANG